jgi:CDP-diacylglycerol--glycerol-3-phosphate 3-phosphatidyltransferase
MASVAGKPWITANQVTFLRLLLIPIPCWLLYQGESAQFAALVFATLLGCTDFVDGYLARKYGGSVLGGLMDPIADKVFVAITFLPAVDLGWVPAWMVAVLFAREFLVTAARTSYELRGQSLKSSYMARYKTWAQMVGIGLIMLINTVSRESMAVVLLSCGAAPIAMFVLRYLIVRKPWKGASWFAISGTTLYIIHQYTSTPTFSTVLMYFILGVTVVSGLGYLSGLGTLRGKGRITAGEIVRLSTSVALPVIAVAAQKTGIAPKWAIIALVSIELAHGGLDNLLAHHHAEAGAVAWGSRLLLECALLGYSLIAISLDWARYDAMAACVVGAGALAAAFWQKRRYYLDTPEKKPIRTSAEVVA